MHRHVCINMYKILQITHIHIFVCICVYMLYKCIHLVMYICRHMSLYPNGCMHMSVCIMHICIYMYMHIHYLFTTGESYGPTAQHMQDCPIFIQLNYVHNNKEMRCCHLMLNFPATRWHSTSSFSIQPFCIAAFLATAVYIF